MRTYAGPDEESTARTLSDPKWKDQQHGEGDEEYADRIATGKRFMGGIAGYLRRNMQPEVLAQAAPGQPIPEDKEPPEPSPKPVEK